MHYPALCTKEGLMRATVVDMRYRMNDVLKALDRNEDVTILYHGRVKGVIKPAVRRNGTRVKEHPFFNMCPDGEAVPAIMEDLRGGRHRAL